MMIKQIFQTTLIAAFLAAGLSGCQADADGSIDGGLNGNGTGQVDGDDGVNDQTGDVEGTDGDAGTSGPDDTGFPNDPNGPGADDVTHDVVQDLPGDQGDVNVAGGDSGYVFVCTETLQQQVGASTSVGADGLVGGPLTDLLNMLGGDSATDLTNSVTDAVNAIDGTLRTASTFTLTASLLGTAIDTIDQNVYTPEGTSVPAGGYAVAALSFPAALANVGLLTEVQVRTFLGDVETEPAVVFDATQIDLLGQNIVGSPYVFVGRKVTKPYDRVTVSLAANVLAADVGEAMYVHEVCTDGALVVAP